MTKSGKRWMTLMKKLKLILVNFIITYFIIINPIKARETISGKVRVIDGDTIVINGFFQKAGIPGKKIKNQKIRLFGIDAPEINQTCISEGVEVFCSSRRFTCRLRGHGLSVLEPSHRSEERRGKKFVPM